MDFEQAYRSIVKASVEQDKIEIPTLLESADFDKARCLDVGCGPLARLATKIAKTRSPRSTTCLEKYPEIARKAGEEISRQRLNKIIEVATYQGYDKEKFPFPDNSFDIVYCAWLPHKTVTDPRFLDEMARVSRKYVLMLMPGIKGDEPKLVSLVNPWEKERRLEYKRQITRDLENRGFEVEYRDGVLSLNFQDIDEIRETFYELAFHQNLDGKKEDVDKFLDARVHNFRDGFYVIRGVK